MGTINSSLIAAAETRGNDLIVTLKDGNRKYRYAGAAHLAEGLRTAPSAGRFFRQEIRDKFPTTQVEA